MTHCQRCGRLCRSQGPAGQGARLLRKAAEGLCPNCAVTEFLRSISPLSEILEKRGPEVLRSPHVQAQFALMMASGNADMRPEEIDWDAVIANWELKEQ